MLVDQHGEFPAQNPLAGLDGGGGRFPGPGGRWQGDAPDGAAPEVAGQGRPGPREIPRVLGSAHRRQVGTLQVQQVQESGVVDTRGSGPGRIVAGG